MRGNIYRLLNKTLGCKNLSYKTFLKNLIWIVDYPKKVVYLWWCFRTRFFKNWCVNTNLQKGFVSHKKKVERLQTNFVQIFFRKTCFIQIYFCILHLMSLCFLKPHHRASTQIYKKILFLTSIISKEFSVKLK